MSMGLVRERVKTRRPADILRSVVTVVSGHIAGWIVVVMMGMVLVEVAARYIFNSPLRVADEIGAYMLVAIVFLGLAYAWQEKAHVRIEFMLNIVPPRVRKRLELIMLIIAIALVPFLAWACYGIILSSIQLGLRGYGWMRIPLVYPRLPMFIGMVLLIFPMIADLIEMIKSFRVKVEKP